MAALPEGSAASFHLKNTAGLLPPRLRTVVTAPLVVAVVTDLTVITLAFDEHRVRDVILDDRRVIRALGQVPGVCRHDSHLPKVKRTSVDTT